MIRERLTRFARSPIIFIFAGSRFFLNDHECSMSNVCYILSKNNGNKTKKHLKNEQRSKDSAAKKNPNTSGVNREN